MLPVFLMMVVGRYQQAAAFMPTSMADCTGCCPLRGTYGCRVYLCEDYYDCPTNMCRDFDEKLDELTDGLYNCGPVKSLSNIQSYWSYDGSLQVLKPRWPPREKTCPPVEDVRKARMNYYGMNFWWSIERILETNKHIYDMQFEINWLHDVKGHHKYRLWDYEDVLKAEIDIQNKIVEDQNKLQKHQKLTVYQKFTDGQGRLCPKIDAYVFWRNSKDFSTQIESLISIINDDVKDFEQLTEELLLLRLKLVNIKISECGILRFVAEKLDRDLINNTYTAEADRWCHCSYKDIHDVGLPWVMITNEISKNYLEKKSLGSK